MCVFVSANLFKETLLFLDNATPSYQKLGPSVCPVMRLDILSVCLMSLRMINVFVTPFFASKKVAAKPLVGRFLAVLEAVSSPTLV